MNCNYFLRHASFFVFATTIAAGPAIAQADVTVYVSANGSDSYDGSAASYSTGTTGPVKTLAHAQALIRAARGNDTSTHAVMYVGAGTYNFSNSLSLSSQDSNLTISGATNNGTMLTGSVPITGWDHYMSPALRRRFSANVIKKLYSSATSANLGVIQLQHGSQTTNTAAELIMGGSPMQLVRFPATGYMNVTSVDSTGQNITTDQNRKIASASDCWMTGFFNNNSAASTVQVTAAPSTNQYSLAAAQYSEAVPVVGSRVAVLNQPEDLQYPGQYYIDRSAGRVYFYPPAASDTLLSTSTAITSLDGPVIMINSASNVQLNNVVVQGSRATGINLINCTNTSINSCIIRAVAQQGFLINGGSNNSIAGSEIADTGAQGIFAFSGDITTLTNSNLTITNNLIHRTGRNEQSFSQGVYIGGCGNTVSSNTFSDLPAGAIGFEGCNHLIQGNDISTVLEQVNDAGAIYCGRKITDRGNKIDSNIIHNISLPGAYANFLVGVYIDDCDSGMTVTNNIFSGIPVGVEVGGGQSNLVQGNAFAMVTTPVQMDARGAVGFMQGWFANGGGYYQQLASMTPSQISLFKSRFPDFAAMYNSSTPGMPVNNNISNNFFPTPQSTIQYIDSIVASLVYLSNNATDGNTLFVNPLSGNFNLNPVAPGSPTPSTPSTAGAGSTATSGTAS